MPDEKEPDSLLDDRVTSDRGQRSYAALYRQARPDEIRGEGSTNYTKRPTHTGVAARARQVLGPDLKLIYLVREPVSRLVSHHHHELGDPTVSEDVNEAVRSYHPLIAYSRYVMQLEPWLQAFGLDQLSIVQFESYIADRKTTVEQLGAFLGFDVHPEQIDTNQIFNRTTRKPVTKGWLKRFQTSVLYRRYLRRLTSRAVREMVKQRLLPRHPPRPEPPTPQTVDWIIEQVQDDAKALGKLLGRSDPLWDFDAVRRKYSRLGIMDTVEPASAAVPSGG